MDLSVDARKRKREELARQTTEKLEKLPSVEKARRSVAAITASWQAKIDGVMVRPKAEGAATALLLREVRDKFASLTPAAKEAAPGSKADSGIAVHECVYEVTP